MAVTAAPVTDALIGVRRLDEVVEYTATVSPGRVQAGFTPEWGALPVVGGPGGDTLTRKETDKIDDMTADRASALLDHFEVVRVVGRYGRAIDTRDWKLLRHCLADSVHVDFSRYSRPPGPSPAVRSADDWVAWVRGFVGDVIHTEHLTANHDVDLDGDDAQVRFSLRVQRHEETEAGVKDNTSHANASYQLRRQEGRWLITGLRADLLWLDGDPTIGQSTA